MGAAVYNRGSKLLSKTIDRESPDGISVLIRDLNAIPRKGAVTPFSRVHFVPGNGGWWALDPKKDSGFWHRTLRGAIAAYNVLVTSVAIVNGEVTYAAEPVALPEGGAK